MMITLTEDGDSLNFLGGGQQVISTALTELLNPRVFVSSPSTPVYFSHPVTTGGSVWLQDHV